MYLLTEDAMLVCDHELGTVQVVTSQSLFTIEGRKVMVENDPQGRYIVGCPNLNIGIVPCTITLKVDSGYSNWIRVEGHRVCLDQIKGLTNGTPPGVVKYKVRAAGQDFVGEMQ
jgi:hypothetical protein